MLQQHLQNLLNFFCKIADFLEALMLLVLLLELEIVTCKGCFHHHWAIAKDWWKKKTKITAQARLEPETFGNSTSRSCKGCQCLPVLQLVVVNAREMEEKLCVLLLHTQVVL
jgi:hypothetical protein